MLLPFGLNRIVEDHDGEGAVVDIARLVLLG